jgi:ribulokinase
VKQIGVIGVDIGTESLRTVLFDLEGSVLAISQYPYNVSSPQSGHFEQDPVEWWTALKVTVADCRKQAGLPPESIISVGVDGTSCTVVPVDREGAPLRPAILWMDTRAFKEAKEITETCHPALQPAGGRVSAEWLVPKALWIKRHEPDIWQKTYKLVEGTDYITWKMTGRWTVAIGSAVGKRHWSHAFGGWPTDLYNRIGLPELVERGSGPVIFLGEAAGTMTLESARELGLAPGTMVTNCGPDAYVSMVGMNVFSPKQMGLVIGSSNVQMVPLSQKVSSPGMWGPWLDIVLRDQWILEGGQLATGSIIRWFANQFGTSVQDKARQKGVSVYRLLDKWAECIPPGSDGLVVLDYWCGNRTPFNDAVATGAIWGLTLNHTLPHVYRAILEGTAYGTAHTLQEFRKCGAQPEVIVVCGGGARSTLWLQIYADVCGLPVQTTDFTGASALGSAICAAVAAGYYKDLLDAAASMVRVTTIFEPRLQLTRLYSEYLQHYLATYEVLHESMHAMASQRYKQDPIGS